MDRKLLLGAAAGTAAVVGVAAAVRAADARWEAAEDPCAPEDRLLPPGERLEVRTDDGAELVVTVSGEGPDVVLAHCWTGGREMWAPVAHRLIRSGHRVVLYDQRGHGSSTVGDDGFTIPSLGHDLRAVLEAVDARDAVLAGHSMGGMAIQSLAVEHLDVLAERTRGLVLVATAAGGLHMGRRKPIAERVLDSSLVERAMRTSAGHALFRGTVGRSVARHHLVLGRDLFCACAPEARVGWFTAMQAMDLREGIAHIDVPVTIINGDRDILTPPGRSAELARTIPGARLITLPDHGHTLPLEAPDALAERIAELAGTLQPRTLQLT